jgi:ubiquinone/menaquinone biosynthesis C-methylase UbiE
MDYYNGISRGYDELYGEEQKKKIRLILEILKNNGVIISRNSKVLDLGAGSGILNRFLDCELYSVDPSKKLLELNPGKRKFIGYAENIPFPDNFFEIVFSITTIQNFKDLRKGLSEIRRVGGKIFILSSLKRSDRIGQIETEILKIFNVKETLEEEKDLIFFAF